MRVEPFQPEHMSALLPRLNANQSLDPATWTPEFCENLAKTAEVYTAVAEDGTPVGILGALPLWPERYHLFAYMSLDSGPYMGGITRAVKRFLSTLQGRVEAEISEGFEEGKRWVELLGFHCETPDGMDSFFPGNRRGYMYAKVLP